MIYTKIIYSKTGINYNNYMIFDEQGMWKSCYRNNGVNCKN